MARELSDTNSSKIMFFSFQKSLVKVLVVDQQPVQIRADLDLDC